MALLTNASVFLFTSLLFLSGYILQQQTVRSLQAAIHPPPAPSQQARPPTEPLVAKSFGQQPHPQQVVLTQHSGRNLRGCAYVQLVRRHEDTCNAVMLLAAFARDRSSASRVLVYPRQWGGESNKRTKKLDTSLRLLQQAATKYGAILIPVDPIEENEGALEQAYPLAGFLSLTKFDRLLYLQPQGLLINSARIDDLFWTQTNSSVTSFISKAQSYQEAFLIRPSASKFSTAAASLHNITSETAWGKLGIDYKEAPSILTSTTTIRMYTREEAENFTPKYFQDSTGYVRFSDPGAPRPSYDIPNSILERVRPKLDGPRRVWNNLYDKYRSDRMNVCGLDLEPLPVIDPGPT